MRFLSTLLLCLLLNFVVSAQTKPVLQRRGDFRFEDASERITAHRFIAGENKLLLVGRKTIRILDAATAKLLESRAIEIPELTEDNPRVISPDGSKMLVFGNHGSRAKKDKIQQPATVWDLQTGKQIAVLEGPTKPVKAGIWSRNGKTLATSSDRYAPRFVDDISVEVSFWDGETFKFRNSLPAERVNWWYLTADGEKCFYSTGPVKNLLFIVKYLDPNGGPIRIWDVGSGKIEKTIPAEQGDVERKVRGISISPDESSLTFVAQRPKSNNAERRLVVWDVGQGGGSKSEMAMRYELSPNPKIDESGITFSPDGKYFAMGAGKNLQIYETENGVKRFELLNVTPGPNYWLDDNKILLYNHGPTMEALDMATGKQLYQQRLVFIETQWSDDNGTYSEVVDSTDIVLHPNRDLFLTYSQQVVEVFNSRTGELLQKVISPPMDYTKKKPRVSDKPLVSKAGWSRDGKSLFVIDAEEKSIALWALLEN